MDDACRAILAQLGQRLALEIEFDDHPAWEARQRALDANAIDFGWICGAPYVKRVDAGAGFDLLAAPVMRGTRYAGRAVYFSDFVVRRDSRFRQLEDLAGAVWAYNEPESYSGFHVVRHALAEAGLDFGFFGRVVETGAHQVSIEQIRRGAVDGAAIDSSVLDWLAARDPRLVAELRVIGTLGPSPMPPWVVAKHVSRPVREVLRRAFTTLHCDPAARETLAAAGIERFAAAHDADYDPIRRVLCESAPGPLLQH